MKAAEEFLHLSRARPDAASRARCKAEVAKALERAEKIKARKTDVAPVAKDHFSERKSRVLAEWIAIDTKHATRGAVLCAAEIVHCQWVFVSVMERRRWCF